MRVLTFQNGKLFCGEFILWELENFRDEWQYSGGPCEERFEESKKGTMSEGKTVMTLPLFRLTLDR